MHPLRPLAVAAGRRGQRQPGKLQGGDPPFGAGGERGDGGGGQTQPHRLVEEGRGFFGREAQRRAADLRHLVACPQAGSGRGGSSRVPMTRCRPGGWCASRKATRSCTAKSRIA